MNKITFISLILSLSIFACQSEAESGQSDNSNSTPAVQKQQPVKRNMAKAIPRPNPEETRAWSILTVDMWHYKFAMSVTETPDDNIYEGYWIDFEDDFSYKKGFYDSVIAQGYYAYDNDTKVLEIIPEEGDDEPSQWNVKTNGEVIILIGTSKFGNNATQIKLERDREFPKKR
jgi:hypothetical protein